MTINDDEIPELSEEFTVSASVDPELPVDINPNMTTVRILDNDSKILLIYLR